MSACFLLRNKNNLYIASDSALSSFDYRGTPIRISEDEKKIFRFNKWLVFLSGEHSVCIGAKKFIEDSGAFDIYLLSSYLKSLNIKKQNDIFSIEVVATSVQNATIDVFQLSEYNNFDIVKHPEPSDNDIYILTAGFKTSDTMGFLIEKLKETRDVVDVFYSTFRKFNSEQIGGFMDLWSMDGKGVIKNIKKIKIDEENKVVQLKSSKKYMVVGQAIVGNIIAGNELRISNPNNNFILDETGATLNNAKFNIQTTNTRVTIDPTAVNPFVIQQNVGGTFVNRMVVNNSGSIDITGTITANAGSIGGIGINTAIPGVSGKGGIYVTSNPSNYYIASNGDIRWGALTITGSSAEFTGTIRADRLLGAVSWSQLTDIPAEKITSGTMSGNRIFGGTWSGSGMSISLTGTGVPTISGNSGLLLQVAGGSHGLSISTSSPNIVMGTNVFISGYLQVNGQTYLQGTLNINGAIQTGGGLGTNQIRTISTNAGNRTFTWVKGILVSVV